jgi:hypothetical protein
MIAKQSTMNTVPPTTNLFKLCNLAWIAGSYELVILLFNFRNLSYGFNVILNSDVYSLCYYDKYSILLDYNSTIYRTVTL